MSQSVVQRIQFQFYKPSEIKKICPVEITEPFGLDGFGEPIPGGCYDERMGPCDEFRRCGTCNLMHRECPGHFGYYTLSIPFLNPLNLVNFKQFLNMTCVYCVRICVTNRICMFFRDLIQLIECGCVKQAKVYENLYFNYIKYLDVESFKNTMTINTEEIETKVKECIENEAKKYNMNKNEFLTYQTNENKYNVHINNYKKRIINDFIKNVISLRKCERCGRTKWKFKIKDKQVIHMKIDKIPYGKLIKCENNQNTFFNFINEIIIQKKKYKPEYYINNESLYKYSKYLWVNDKDTFGIIYNQQKINHLFFLKLLPISSNRFRSPNKFGGEKSLDDLSSLFCQIIRMDIDLKEYIKKEKKSKNDSCINLQTNEIQKRTKNVQQYLNVLTGITEMRNVSYKGVKHEIDKKGGIFRENTMGKRVNYSARSVLLPDPFIQTHEVSLPIGFATKLTYPERITYHNINLLRKLVKNGPWIYPGANFVEDSNGYRIDLHRYSEQERYSLANRLIKDKYNKVFRHILSGDYCLMNRQPTLHRPSILGHKIKVFRNENCLRIHLANCKSFNADFDGDEMNCHIVQNLLARAEIKSILVGYKQYYSPTSGEPIRGLIQDFIVSSVLLTKKDTFLEKNIYFQLVYTGLQCLNYAKKIKILPPTIIKPVKLWTGKQVISTILENLFEKKKISHFSTTTVKSNLWGIHAFERNVVVIENELLTGVFDKSQIGAKKNSISDAINEIYGEKYSEDFLVSMTRISIEFLQMRGFTCGMEDCLLNQLIDRKRTIFLRKTNEKLQEKLNIFLKGESVEEYFQHNNQLKFDHEAKTTLNKFQTKLVEKAIFSGGLYKEFPYNNLTLMTETGAKGGSVNVSQISCCLGQQLFEGKRVEFSKEGNTLPSFKRYDLSAKSGGFIASRFLDGIDPPEFFYHCQAGRDGLIDTAVKTSKSGYLQRSLVKKLELLSVTYDNTVRDSFNSVVQFEYGSDSIDSTKCGNLYNFKLIAENFKKFKEKFLTNYNREFFKNQKLSVKFSESLRKWIKEKKSFLKKKKIKKRDFKKVAKLFYKNSIVMPGESVGVLAAQGIGEPSTQMTLNTFHFAGVEESHVTQGIPFLRSILMSGTINNGFMKVPLKDDVGEKEFKIISTRLSNLTFRDIMKSVCCSEYCKEESIIHDVEIKFNSYQLHKKYKMNKKDIRSVSEFFISNVGEKVNSIVHRKIFKINKTQQMKLVNDALENTLKDIHSENEDEDKSDDEEEDEGEEDEDDEEKYDSDSDDNDDKIENSKRLKKNNNGVSKYINQTKFDVKKGIINFSIELGNTRINMVDVVKDVSSLIKIRTVNEVKDFRFVSELNSSSNFVRTVGINFNVIWMLQDYVKIDEIETNSIKDFIKCYGIEAGRNLCENLLIGIFESHGVEVNFRHINLVSDFLFYQGSYLPCNRHSKKLIPGVLNKASFETCTSVIGKGSLHKETDYIKDCSSQISVGELTTHGTGSFDVLLKVNNENF